VIQASALILDGKKVRNSIAEDLKANIAAQISAGGTKPVLAIVQIGDNKESEAYIRNKKKFASAIGAEVRHIHLPADVSENDVAEEVAKLNADAGVHGIITQMPFPAGISKDAILECIDPKKDVDGMTSASIKGLWINSKTTFMPATTRGIMSLLKHYGFEIAGKKVVVLGRSALVGKPTALAFSNADATVTVCHSATENLEYHTLAADIIITAVGRPRLLTEFHVKPSHVIVDVGITVEDIPDEVAAHRIVGDADYKNIVNIVHAISPVPGGVGPMTVASLFQNLFDAYLNQRDN
jgi:5,10-methylene-tetrahydrofolate dehydrogenase/methenyl tetrahydrofolate cyclohydrolase